MMYSGNGFFHLPSNLFQLFEPLPDMRKPSTFWIRLEAILVDFQRTNLRFQRGSRYAQLGGRPVRSEYAAPAFLQGGLNHVLLLRHQSPRELNWVLGFCGRKRLLW